VVELTSGEKVRVPADRVNGRGPQIRVGVRPEKIQIARKGAGDGQDNVVEGRVRVATFMGVSNQYTVETRTGQRVIVYAQNLGTSEDRPPGPGEEVTLSWHPEHTFVVSPEDEGAAEAEGEVGDE
jgi:spermidine/putrescine transport system ATP-binding protein